MRLDKFLKVSRIIKRRTVAKEACDQKRVSINDRVAKAGSDLKTGDILTIRFGEQRRSYEILDLKEHVRKEDSREMYREIPEEEQE